MTALKGAILVCCNFCGAQQLPVEWKAGTGWVCSLCHTDMRGRSPSDEVAAVHFDEAAE